MAYINTFKVGDRVEILTKNSRCSFHEIGDIGTVNRVSSSFCTILVDKKLKEEHVIDELSVGQLVGDLNSLPATTSCTASGLGIYSPAVDSSCNGYLLSPHLQQQIHSSQWLVSFAPKLTLKQKMTNAFKRFVDKDLQTTVKAGYRNSDLSLTTQGRDEAIEALLAANTVAKEAFVASAQEVLDEQDKQK